MLEQEEKEEGRAGVVARPQEEPWCFEGPGRHGASQLRELMFAEHFLYELMFAEHFLYARFCS